MEVEKKIFHLFTLAFVVKRFLKDNELNLDL